MWFVIINSTKLSALSEVEKQSLPIPVRIILTLKTKITVLTIWPYGYKQTDNSDDEITMFQNGAGSIKCLQTDWSSPVSPLWKQVWFEEL